MNTVRPLHPQYLPNGRPEHPPLNFAVEDPTMMQSHLNSTSSSPGSFDDHQDPSQTPTVNWQQGLPPNMPNSLPSSAPPSVANSQVSSAPAPSSVAPLQKRRRVTRACDECRRKKIKCDGKQPCTHCTVYSYECTYDQPSNRRRNPAPQYIEALELRLHRTEAFLKALFPNLDTSAPDFDPTKLLPHVEAAARHLQALSQGAQPVSLTDARAPDSQAAEAPLESMVQAAGRLDIDETGHMDFHGHSSGMTYLNHLNNQFGNLLGEVKVSIPPPGKPAADSPASSIQSPGENLPDTSLLPTYDVALTLVGTCMDCACVLMRFIHKPSFMTTMEKIFRKDPDNWDEAENRFLPLLYLAMGVGCLFVDDGKKLGIENITGEAMKYFNAGRRMIEMTDIGDMESLQAALLMIIFLQSSARMQTCYSYVAIALSAAVKMGLHRSLPDARFNPIEREVRKRVFWTCWKMDTYVAALLGLPKGIDMADVDCEFPVEVDDEYITKDSISEQPKDQMSYMAPVNAHTRLLIIMSKVVQYIYPVKGVESSLVGGLGYTVNQAKLYEIESDLGKWLERLPGGLNHGSECPQKFIRCYYLLRMSFAHVQMMLYRPFVHYLLRSKTTSSRDRSQSIGMACVTVSRKIVHITNDMRKAGILNGAYWFTIYTTFFSIITLVYYVLVNPTDERTLEILEDAKLGRQCISSVQDLSLAAKRCTVGLTPLFEKIPEKMHQLQQVNTSRKRARAISVAEIDGREDGQSNPEDDFNMAEAGPPWSSNEDLSSSNAKTPVEFRPTPPPSQQSTPVLRQWNRTNSHMLTERSIQSRASQEQQQQVQRTPENAFQAQLAPSASPGLTDINSVMFPTGSSESFDFAYESLPPQFAKSESSGELPSPLYATNTAANPFGNLEGSMFGPLPPYLLQGQGSYFDSSQLGSGVAPRGNGAQNFQGPQSPLGQFMMTTPGPGPEAMLPDFFRDDWDDIMIQQQQPNGYRPQQ